MDTCKYAYIDIQDYECAWLRVGYDRTHLCHLGYARNVGPDFLRLQQRVLHLAHLMYKADTSVHASLLTAPLRFKIHGNITLSYLRMCEVCTYGVRVGVYVCCAEEGVTCSGELVHLRRPARPARQF